MIYDLSAACESSHQFSYLQKGSDNMLDPISREDLISQSPQVFYTCPEQTGVSETTIMHNYLQ